MAAKRDYYEVLGVSRNANAERIQEQTARYLDLYLMDYLAPMTSSSCSMLYLLIWALILSVIIVLLYFYASHRELNAQQG